MFFKESLVKNLLRCQRCKNSLDEYETEPKLLPCGNTICFNCNLIIINNKKASFKCDLCSNDHSIPANGFSTNEIVRNLIKLQPTEVYRSQLCENLKQKLIKMQTLSNEYKFKIENIENLIREHCDEQRRLIQLNKETKEQEFENEDIQSIKKRKIQDSIKLETLIDQIDDYELNLNKRLLKTLKSDDQIILDNANKLLMDTQSCLCEYQIDESIIRQYHKYSGDLISKLSIKLRHFKANIFNNNLLKFDNDNNLIKFEKIQIQIISFNVNCKRIQLWNFYSDSNKFDHIKTLNCESNVDSALNIDNKLICGLENGSIQIFNVITYEVIRIVRDAHSEGIKCIQLWNNKLVTASNDLKIKLFDLNTFECILTLNGHYDPVIHIYIQDDNLISSSTLQIKVWCLTTGTCLNTKRKQASSIHMYLKNELYADTCKKSIQITNNEGVVKTLNGHNYSISCLAELDNNKIASCSYDGIINIWNIETEEILLKINANLRDESEVIGRCTIYALDGDKILSSFYNSLNVWDINTGECLQTLDKIQDVYILK